MRKLLFGLIAALPAASVCGYAVTTSDPGDNPAFHRISHIESFIPPAGQLRDRLDTLAREAEAGDDHAATLLYAGLAACSTAKRAEDQSAYLSGCKDITQEQLEQRAKWLKMAADRGYQPARYIYAASGVTEALGSTGYALEHPEEVQAYLSTARRYLEQLAQACNVDAISIIAFNASKADGLLYGNDPETAYKYEVISNKLLSTHSPNQQLRLEARIAPQRIFALQSEASSFVTEHCK